MYFQDLAPDDALLEFSQFVRVDAVNRSKNLERLRSRIIDEFLDARNSLNLQITGNAVGQEIQAFITSVQNFTQILSPQK
jgi:hypothetical protein